jgi:hypothetical protein
MEHRRRLWALAAAAFGLLAVMTFQSFAFTIVGGVLVAQLASILADGRAPSAASARASLSRSVLLVAPIATAVVAGAALYYVLVERGSYVEGFIGWGTVGTLTTIDRLVANLGSYLVGSGFFGGWILLPTIAAAVVLLAFVLRMSLRRRAWYAILLLAVICLMPFAMSAVLGTPLPNRAMQTLPLIAASIWLLLGLVLPRTNAVMAGLLAVAVLFAIWNAGITTRLFVAEDYSFQTDRTIAGQIAERLASEGWEGQPIPIVVVGDRRLGPVERFASHETFGKSFFNWGDGGRSSIFMRVLGYQMDFPTDDQKIAARARSESMPAWPAAGSVVLHEGTAVVKFSEP